MPIGPKRIPFFEHIQELRYRLIVVVVTLVVASTVLYAFTDPILQWLLAPIHGLLPGDKLNVFGPFETFTFRFKIALYAAIVVTSPVILWQVFAFFLPALQPKERKFFVPTIAVAVGLFVAGNAFCYKIILNTAIGWMLGQAGTNIAVVPAADKFLSGITLLMLGFGIAFELPIIVFYAIGFGLIPYAKLRASWRYVYVALMIIASVATPDWSPITMGLLFGALVFLYEGSLLLSRLVFGKRIRQQAIDAAEAVEALS